ncbi:MAG: hypothetical protein M0P12_12315 [Paludibacteraceae bacterium]|nr:hypothetical protein [Paludibacteraceae bacterium]
MEDIEYNDNEAIDFILKRLPKEEKEKITRDDVDYLMDIIYDFYYDNGFLGESNSDQSVEIDEQEMSDFIANRVAADGKGNYITEDVISDILDGEYEYCKSIGIYK